MDISPKLTAHLVNYVLCDIYHASEEGRRRLAHVRPIHSTQYYYVLMSVTLGN